MSNCPWTRTSKYRQARAQLLKLLSACLNFPKLSSRQALQSAWHLSHDSFRRRLFIPTCPVLLSRNALTGSSSCNKNALTYPNQPWIRLDYSPSHPNPYPPDSELTSALPTKIKNQELSSFSLPCTLWLFNMRKRAPLAYSRC